MTLQLLEILQSKQALRRRLAVLPIAEKLRLLDELRERSQSIGISRAQRHTAVEWVREWCPHSLPVVARGLLPAIYRRADFPHRAAP